MAATPLPRLTMFFQGFGYAWSESWFSTRTTTDQETLALATQIGGLCFARDNLLAPGYTLLAARASDDTVFRDSQLQATPAAVPPGFTTGKITGVKSGPSTDVLVLRGEFGAGFRRTVEIGGCPLDVFTQPFDATIPQVPGYASLLNAFGRTIISGGWGFKYRQRDDTLAKEVPITNVASDPSGLITVTAPAHGMTPATFDKVIIRNIKMKTGSLRVNGERRVFVVDATTYTIKDLSGVAEYDHGGFTRPLRFALAPISNLPLVSARKRKRGVVPYSRPLGRSRKRPTVV